MMLKHTTKEQLLQLNLKAFANALEEEASVYLDENLNFEDQLNVFLDLEVNDKNNKRIERLRKSAKLRYSNAQVENIDYRASRKLKKQDVNHLYNTYWIRNHQNVIITGATGSGKTWLACALANQACRQGINALYIHINNLLEDIALAQIDGSIAKYRQKLIRMKLLIIDDIGLGGIEASLSPTLFDIIDKQSINGALILTSQFPTEKWHNFFEDKTVGEAILDRVIHNSHEIKIFGESMRKRKK